MKGKFIAIVFLFSLLFCIIFVNTAQAAEIGWEKTVTLSSGEVILDMSGEWEMVWEGYGETGYKGSMLDLLTISQEGSKFTAITQFGSPWVPKGSQTIRGELDKDGFKTIYHYTLAKDIYSNELIWELCRWEITDGGNKVVLDCGERVRATLTRR